MPPFVNQGVPRTKALPAVRSFAEPVLFPERNYTISGVTKDVNDAILGGCLVRLFDTATNVLEQSTTSDATTGTYSFNVDKTRTFFVVSYLVGAPDVAGTSLNTLQGG